MHDDELIRVLNHYRAAELRGASVILRLGRLADTTPVRANFTQHLRDEGNHAWLWTKAVLDLGGELEEVADPYQARLGSVFGMPRTVEELLAVTLVSERRGVTTYEDHLSLPDVPTNVRRALGAVLKDEQWHVSWITDELEARFADGGHREILERAEAADIEAAASLRLEVGLAPSTS